MKIKLLIYFFVFAFLGLAITPNLNKAFALDTDGYLCSNNGSTVWGVAARYSDPGVGSVTINDYADTSLGASTHCGSGFDRYLYFYSGDRSSPSNDYVVWHTACVDPVTFPDVSVKSIPKYGETWYEYHIDIGCHSIVNAKYAGCYHLSYTNRSGSISSSAQCPYTDSTSSYCTRGGCTAYPALCAASHCGGSGNCTWYNKNCDGPYPSDCSNKTGATGCSYSTTAYSTNCGGNNISGTYICSSYSKSCAPPGPTVTLSAICNGTNPNIRVNYTSNAGSRGTSNYDLRWRASGASAWNSVCSPPTAGSGYDYVITTTALDDNTTYQVQVRQHTGSAYNGPTNFGSATVTTPTCNPTYTISGTVFLDDGSGGGTAGDGIRNGSEPVFTSGANITITNTSTGAVTTTSSNGSGVYSTSKKNGSYSISASVTNYHVTSTNPRSVTVSGANVNNINFGLLPNLAANPWYQSVGGDVREDDGISVSLPTGQYFSASQATPVLDGGVVFTSQPSASFGGGAPNANNWLAKDNSFSPLPPGIKTSYAFINANVQKLGSITTSISAFPGSLASGNYIYKISGNLSIPAGADFTFPANGTYIFLVDGNLTIDRNLIVPSGTIAIFIASGNITIGSDVTRLDGIYSADEQFKFDTNGSRTDTALIVQGSIIGNAGLQTPIPFVNLRDLGDVNNATTPSVKVIFRPDFVLHVPDLVKKTTYFVSEKAPVGGN